MAGSWTDKEFVRSAYQKMIYTIVSDIHNRVEKTENSLYTLNKLHGEADRVIFLGDYFDSYKDSAVEATLTAEWLAKSIQQPERLHLAGNHDMPYLVESVPGWLWCPGYSEEKKNVVVATLGGVGESLVGKIRGAMYIPEVNLFLSHAGMHPGIVPMPEALMLEEAKKDGLDGVPAFMEHQINLVFDLLLRGQWPFTKPSPYFRYGARMGWRGIGGVTWLDAKMEFSSFPDLNQVFGHTIFDMPTSFSTETEVNFALDTVSDYYYRLVIPENGPGELYSYLFDEGLKTPKLLATLPKREITQATGKEDH